MKTQNGCSKHPDAPHGFNRSSSHSEGRYVCDCEGWIPDNESTQNHSSWGEIGFLPEEELVSSEIALKNAIAFSMAHDETLVGVWGTDEDTPTILVLDGNVYKLQNKS